QAAGAPSPQAPLGCGAGAPPSRGPRCACGSIGPVRGRSSPTSIGVLRKNVISGESTPPRDDSLGRGGEAGDESPAAAQLAHREHQLVAPLLQGEVDRVVLRIDDPEEGGVAEVLSAAAAV